MKKIFATIILLLYLVPGIGMTVTAHYCGNKLISISILRNGGQPCSCGVKPMKKNCCKDKTAVFKIKDVQQKAMRLSFNAEKTFQLAFNEPPLLRLVFEPLLFTNNIYNNSHPPGVEKKQLYLLFQVLII